MIRKARLYARVKQGHRYPRVAVDHDRNGRAIQPRGQVTTYMVRRGGMFEDVGKDFAVAVTRLHQMQAQLHGGVTQEEAMRGRFQKPGDPGLLSRDDLPKPLKRKPKKYDRESIDALLKHADEEQRDYLEFLLWSGFRDEEVQFLLYSDFDFKNSKVSVQAKPQFNWRPKDAEERTVQVPSEISKRIKQRMERHERSSNDLVFPNGADKPDSHLIYRLHAVAKKAGLDLKGKRAGHMFRKTAGSRVANKFGLRAAMDFLGHSDSYSALCLLPTEIESRHLFVSGNPNYQIEGHDDRPVAQRRLGWAASLLSS